MFKEEYALREQRIDQALRIIGSRLFRETTDLSVSHRKVKAHAPFAQRPTTNFHAIHVGDVWGSGQDRAWFLIEGRVPGHWDNNRIALWLDFGTEALLFTDKGDIVHGLTSGPLFQDTPWKMSRPLADITSHIAPGSPFSFVAEAACLSHPWQEVYDGPTTPPLTVAGFPRGVLHAATLGWFDESVWALYMDMEILINLCKALPADHTRRAKVFRVLNLACDQFGQDPNDVSAVREILQPALSAPAHHSAISVYATGHAHLDTGWLWTTATAREKAARTFSNQLDLMDRYPDYTFGASSALHYQWIKEDHPALYERIRSHVRSGRWEIQGAMWIEADANLPSGESLIRQFLYGKGFFKREFGLDLDMLWLPDVFGYPASLPQIMRVCGVSKLLTQKISWSQFNTFPHHTFIWQGIDGSEVLAHFPPENKYCSSLTPSELIQAEQRFAERDRLDHMLSLFGYGDGGGGPTPFHIERAQRMNNLEGTPKVALGRADSFFAAIERQSHLLHRWTGELYLELHRKTLTTQAFIKHDNRRLEERLMALEMCCAMDLSTYPQEKLESIWKVLLLNQFHDILPGSSICEVYEDARAQFEEAFAECDRIEADWATRALEQKNNTLTVFNPLSVAYEDVIKLPASFMNKTFSDESGRSHTAQASGGHLFASVSIPPLSFRSFTTQDGHPEPVHEAPELLLENDNILYRFNADGQLAAIEDKHHSLTYMTAAQCGNALRLFNDRPAQWEAWDMDVYYEDECIETARCVRCSPARIGPLFSEFDAEYVVGDSRISQTIRLRTNSCRLDFITEVDWRESRRLLRVAFPTTIRSTEAAYDIQFGYVRRPTHQNTSRDMAMFEVCGHRYADCSDSDHGVALLSDSKYGYRVRDGELSCSLLASPCMPDPEADRGPQHFTYALLPHNGTLTESSVQAEAAQLNHKPRLWLGRATATTHGIPVQIEGQDLQVAALKKAEQESAWILRVSETAGRQSIGTLHFGQPVTLCECNAVEEITGQRASVTSSHMIQLKPFAIRTWLVKPR